MAAPVKGPLLSSGTFVLTQEECVVKAEILQALQYVENNYSFASAEKDSERFKAMFPDSKIAKHYRQGKTKVRYNTQFDIVSYIKDLLVKDFSDCPFNFKFDETTMSKVQKRYNAYVQYWSKISGCIVCVYCGSLFVAGLHKLRAWLRPCT